MYLLEGGLNRWIGVFGSEDEQITATPAPPGADRLGYSFSAALGDRYQAAEPDPHDWRLDFTPKIKLDVKRDKSGGGCG